MLSNASFFPTYFNSYFVGKQVTKSPFEDLKSLSDLTAILTTDNCSFDQWLAWKNDIKAFILKHSADLEQLDSFFASITKWGLARNPQKTKAFFAEIVSLEVLTNVITVKTGNSFFTNIFDFAAKNAADLPEISANTSLMVSEWKRCRPLILYFIPNLINIFFGAFSFLDSRKKFNTLWEKHLLLEIVCKFFVIPYYLITILQPAFNVTAKVYFVAVTIILAAGMLIYCYQRWLRPLPDEIVNCTNLDKQMEIGIIDPKVGQTKEIDRLTAALEAHDNIALIGLSGEGKTALIHHFIQLKHARKLPKKLQRLTVYEANCGLMISSVGFGHADLINYMRDQISGYEDKILLFFDEFHHMTTNKGAYLAFKKKILEDKPHCKIIVALTCKEWEELKKIDHDYSFRRRVFRLKIGSPNDVQIRKIIQSFHYRFAPDVPVTEQAIDSIIKISAREDYLPDIGRAAKAEEIFKTAVGLCRASLNHHYGAIELSQEQLKFHSKLIKKIKKIIAHQRKLETDYQRLSHLFSKVVFQQSFIYDDDVDMAHIGEIDISADDENNLKRKSIQAPVFKELISKKDQIMYLWYCFYAEKIMEKLLKSEIEKLDPKTPLQVDENLVQYVYKEIREIENNELSKSKQEK